jgi:prolyl-tRNA synthetase
MKDLYTFDVTQQDAFKTYDDINNAYFRYVVCVCVYSDCPLSTQAATFAAQSSQHSPSMCLRMLVCLCSIFHRLGFDAVRVEADSGNIGGNRSHEFHVVSQHGFDDLLHCSSCDYAANVEKARSHISSSSPSASDLPSPLSSHWSADPHVHQLMAAALQRAQQAAQRKGSQCDVASSS